MEQRGSENLRLRTHTISASIENKENLLDKFFDDGR